MTQTNKPQEIDAHNWYYEEARGIEVIHEVHVEPGYHVSATGYLRTDHIKIPWKKLRASLARHDHKKGKE